ncbi:hypothetical protein [Kurthia zopfii]|uniref:hypothetical protein n=1 Tax=Kurthia zopfii TaxID=1650 RepID=UPI001E53969C|nr:hypothetical protein [Kurthia zopfii]
MVHALKQGGFAAEVIFYELERQQEILNYVLANGVAYVSRINPGNLKHELAYLLCSANFVMMASSICHIQTL